MLLSMGTLCLDGDHHGLHFGALGLIGSLLGRLWVPFGLHWARQGTQMSYLAFLCRREHQIEGPRVGVGAQGRAACGTGFATGFKRAVAPKEE